MPQSTSNSVSYHAVNACKPTAHYTRGPSHEEPSSYEQPAGHLISRKPVPCHDTEDEPKHMDTRTHEQAPDAARRAPESSPRHGILGVFSIWWPEMVCCAVSTGAFLAVVATIYSYQGRPLPEWPYHLTINTLIAIYIVVLKATLLFVAAQGLGQLKWLWFERERPLDHLADFDNASRGAWGSMKLLWMLKGRCTTASCGAFITVAALLADPFAQQVISTYQCHSNMQSTYATIRLWHRSTAADMCAYTLGVAYLSCHVDSLDLELPHGHGHRDRTKRRETS